MANGECQMQKMVRAVVRKAAEMAEVVSAKLCSKWLPSEIINLSS